MLDGLNASETPELIFVTAHDHYAVQAFDSYALHFLLKPINDDQFDEAIRRARTEIAQKESIGVSAPARVEAGVSNDKTEHQTSYWSRLVIKDRDRFVLLKTDEIDWIGSASNYAELHARQRSYLLRMPISDLEAKLDPSRFARISRSTIVNVEQISVPR